MNYDRASNDPNAFINHAQIEKIMSKAQEKANDAIYVKSLLEKAKTYVGLTSNEVCVLSFVSDTQILEEIYTIAREIKEFIYGKRIVMFAPIYISDYCVNECAYCAYHHSADMPRKKLTKQELEEEIKVVEKLGHKRLALECGEDPENCDMDYILECIDTIYHVKLDNGAIRRVNINVAATTVENYKRLKDAGIGTYILFQETYHKETYKKMHTKGPKSNYDYHTTAHDRAMEAGIDDVGVGALFGLYDWHYELTAMCMHKEHLEEVFGVGPHTMSVPRIRAAAGVDNTNMPYAVGDDDFKKLVAIIRLAVPYTGIIMSTRESAAFRNELLEVGVSQLSAGSCTGVGGYTANYYNKENTQKPQFEVSDERPTMEVIAGLMEDGYIPSFCTACYREGRTGDRFMQLAKTGQIANVCQANSLITLKEYTQDYGDQMFQTLANTIISQEIDSIPNIKVKELTRSYMKKIEQGERDFRF